MNQESSTSPTRGLYPLLFVFGCWALCLIISLWTYGPVAPRSMSAPADQFSAARAEVILDSLVGDSIPHPAGSPQNRIVRERIVRMLESYGYEVEIQSGIGTIPERARHRSPDRDQVDLHNIIAIRRAGQDEASPEQDDSSPAAVMLAAHYDSVPMGPGASDDGVGVSVLLEIARMMANEPNPQRDLVFLMTDGEEFGLMGARLFVDDHPLADRIGVVVNLEARGTSGPSMMFETSRNSRALVSIFSRSSPKPFSSSLFYEVYKRLPRDTDFTLFKRKGMLGYNFAFIGNVRNYHTEADRIENVDRGSLQHHGENALGLIRRLLDSSETSGLFGDPLAERNTVEEQSDEAVYFDVMGQWLVWWPRSWSLGICLVGALFFGIAVFGTGAHSGSDAPQADWRESAWGTGKQIGFLILGIVVVMVLGCGLQALLRLDPRLSSGWPLRPFPIMGGFGLASFALIGGMACGCSRTPSPRSVWMGFSFVWLAFACLASLFVNGASYLFIIPIVATSFFSVFATRFGERGLMATAMVAAISIGVIWIPLEPIFYDAVGFQMPVATFFRMSMVATSLPGLLFLAHRRIRFSFAILMTVLSVASLVIALVVNSDV